jgi:hypothetical protein
VQDERPAERLHGGSGDHARANRVGVRTFQGLDAAARRTPRDALPTPNGPPACLRGGTSGYRGSGERAVAGASFP